MALSRFLTASVLMITLSSACSRGPANQSASKSEGNPSTSEAQTKPPVPTSEQPASKGPDQDAVDALKNMSSFLSGLNSFDLVSTANLDAVTKTDQRIQLGGTAHYKVKKPGIRLDFDSDLKDRSYFYDGKQFTIYSPKLGFYASMAAPPTNREFIKMLYDKYGISLPLEDLFRWNDADESDIKALTSGFLVGPSTVEGVPTDHWAFRQRQYDWEVWIERGAQPLPRKLVIVDRTDPTHPTYSAELQWRLNPTFPASIFTFKPDSNAKQIHIAQFKGQAS